MEFSIVFENGKPKIVYGEVEGGYKIDPDYGRKKLWLAVTLDEYELPMVVCDTADELAEWCGYTQTATLYRCISERDGVIERLGCRVLSTVEKEDWEE